MSLKSKLSNETLADLGYVKIHINAFLKEAPVANTFPLQQALSLVDAVVAREAVLAPQTEKFLSDRAKEILFMCDNSGMPASLYVMGLASDIQHCLGNNEMVNEICEKIKIITDHRLAKKDEHGRHT